jgi:hypothetical protein
MIVLLFNGIAGIISLRRKRMNDPNQEPKDPELKVEDLPKDEGATEKEAENVTGGAAFNAQTLAKGGGKEEVQGLLNK